MSTISKLHICFKSAGKCKVMIEYFKKFNSYFFLARTRRRDINIVCGLIGSAKIVVAKSFGGCDR